MTFSEPIIPHDACRCNRDDCRDPGELLRRALGERAVFQGGFCTDATGRAFALDMVRRGYPRTVVLRIAARGIG